MTRAVEIREFAQRVERVCDFLLDLLSAEGMKNKSTDARVIEDLRDDAVSIQFNRIDYPHLFEGLDTYIRGIPINKAETKE
jgi:hypothetical protein